MTGKSKHKRVKRHHPQSKKGKSRRYFEAPITQQSAVTETAEHVSQPSTSTPLQSTPGPLARPAAARYPYIAAELRTISILAGVILIVFIALFFVLG